MHRLIKMSKSITNIYFTTSVNPWNMIHLWNKSRISFVDVDSIYNNPIQLYVANPYEEHSHNKSYEESLNKFSDFDHTIDPYDTLGVKIWKQ